LTAVFVCFASNDINKPDDDTVL